MESPPQEVLNTLFRDQTFLRALFEQFPPKGARDGAEWKQFLQVISLLALSERCLHYLAFQYRVSVDTIRQAIWPRRNTP